MKLQVLLIVGSIFITINQFLLVAQDFQLPVRVTCNKVNACECARKDSITFDIPLILQQIKHGDFQDSLIACAYHQIAIEYYYEFNNELKSLEYNRKAQKIRSKITDGLLWRSKLNIGINYYNLNEYKQAIEYFEAALTLVGEKEAFDLITIYMSQAECYMEIGDFDSAINFAEKAINIKADQYGMNTAKNAFSSILINSKDSLNLIKAIEYSKEVLELSQSINDNENLVTAFNNLANANEILNNFDLALKYYEKAIEIMDMVDTLDIAILTSNIGLAYKDQNKQELSISKQKKSLFLFQEYFKTKYQYEYSANYENLAGNYIALQQFDTSLIHYQKALINLTNNFRTEDIYRNPNSKDSTLFIYSNPDIIRVLHLKATAAYKYYQQNKEIKYLYLADNCYQTAFNFHNKLQRDISTENSRLFQVKNIVPYIENALKIAYQQQENGQDVSKAAFRFMEKNKATVLLQSMNEADALQFANLPDSLLEQEKDLKIAIAYHTKQLNEALSELSLSGGGSKGGGTEIEKLNKILFEEKQQYNQLIKQLEKNYPNYYRLKYQQNQTQLKEVQQSLDDQTALVEYFVGNSAVYILSIIKDHSHLYQLEKSDNWKQTITNLKENISDIKSYDKVSFATNARFLGKLLLDSILCALPDSINRLQIIPDAELNYIPFEVLLTEDVDEHNIQFKNLNYLLKSKSIGYAYSATLWLENIKSTSPPKTFPYGGYAPEYFDEDLPIVRKLVKALAVLLNGKAFIGKEATLSNFLKDENSYTILHLAMHGIINNKKPLSSYLAFYPIGDFKLKAYDLYNMEINSDLAILQACDTGKGELQKGEGVMSLSRAFTYAGCPSLVMSLWKIPEETTSEITKSFIVYLENGFTKDVALQQAKLDYLNNTSKPKASPAYWAGLVATGNLNPISLD